MKNIVKGLERPSKETENCQQERIKVYFENGLNFEKENKIDEAIKSYEVALSIYDSEKMDKEIFEVYMKVGDLYQISGLIEKGLHYFEIAYNMAKILINKELQVDALNKITDSYISNCEIEKSSKYAEKTNSILHEIDYPKGKIENSICLSRIFFVKKEFYKARDICNEALKLCGEKFPFCKGRIFITLGELYKDITSAEEHLDLLRQAYECFEKVDYKRGMLGVINNLAYVYGDKLQDYEKALEYLMKLKELSENSMYVEFHKISFLNIGEAYLKCFKYDKALFWLNEALKNPIGAYTDNIMVYNYAYLSLSNLKLCNYHEAYEFYLKAKEEVNKNSSVESSLVQYYKIAATLFIEFGETSKAKSFIKQALDCVGKDETIIKWNIGLVYEHIKLFEAKNEMDIIETLGGIRYTLSKYKNNDEILNSVYDISITLISMEYYDLVFNFLNEYSSMNSDNDNLRLKKIFIDIKYNELNRYADLDLLINALELTKLTKNVKFEWNICYLIGDYYFRINNLDNAIIYYTEAFNIIRSLVLSIPEKYRLKFANSSKVTEVYNKLIMAKQYDTKATNAGCFDCKEVICKEQLDEIFSNAINK
jgi:tetratricopeptide (TPR) repeat protein